jgi:hypothetical protein
MSYLLKALQKAEQERQQKIHVEHDEPITIQQKSSLPIGLVLLVVLLLVVTLWQVWPSTADMSADEFSEESFSTSAKKVILKEPAILEQEVLPLPQLETLKGHEAASQPAITLAKAKDLSQLTAQELARIPSLNLASHIYSSAAEFRSVVINDQTYKEGALIRAGLILEEINQSGIVINIHGQRVELPKGISWVASQDAK